MPQFCAAVSNRVATCCRQTRLSGRRRVRFSDRKFHTTVKLLESFKRRTIVVGKSARVQKIPATLKREGRQSGSGQVD